ncbi:MAG: hypothetical protein RML12_07585 [Xanthomonadales bacterium]|nr:hypothetical protein [Xanthomonadales bacterium]
MSPRPHRPCGDSSPTRDWIRGGRRRSTPRLARIHALARKHRVREGELRAHAERLRAELAALAGRGERERALLAEREALAARWREGRHRSSGASAPRPPERLAARVEALLGELSMAGARFRIALEPTGGAEPDPLGAERAEYLFSANPGEEPRPLRRIASGGELARVALAIEVAVLDADPIPTMVFDEVDAGIGGAVAEVVGRHLRRLGERRQVLCVTHLAQVACHGHAHLRALKEPRGERVLTRFEPLDRAMRVEEMARMLDGAAVGKESRALAGRLLAQAEAR